MAFNNHDSLEKLVIKFNTPVPMSTFKSCTSPTPFAAQKMREKGWNYAYSLTPYLVEGHPCFLLGSPEGDGSKDPLTWGCIKLSDLT